MRKIILFVFVFATIIVSYHYYSIYSAKRQILELSAPTSNLSFVTSPFSIHDLGSHFIVGYDNFEDLKELVNLGIIGGVFVTSKNLGDLSINQIKKNIQELQDIQSKNGLPPLFIATDQEGGGVQRLSPPLSKLPALSTLIDQSACGVSPGSCFTDPERQAVRDYAATQSAELSDLGINLNFAPVVDIYQGIKVNNDKYTHLETRALSSYPWLVGEIASIYSQEMIARGVTPTLKHFPGLGSSTGDSHLASTHLTKSLVEFENYDFLTFKKITETTSVAIMLSHVTLDAIDSSTPASYSAPVIKYLRQDLGFEGLLVTDDFSMYPVQFGSEGVGGASVKALNAGVDLILISYNPDLFYTSMLALLKSQDNGQLDKVMLEKSRERLLKAGLWTKDHGSE